MNVNIRCCIFPKKTKNPLQKKNDLIAFLQKGTVIQVRMKNEVRILKELLYASLNSATVENSSIICALNLVNVCGTCYSQDANELPVDI